MNDLICVTAVEGEPRVLDTELAAALGMSEPQFIRANVIQPNRAEIEGFGILIERKSNSGKRGRPSTAFGNVHGRGGKTPMKDRAGAGRSSHTA